VVQEEELEVQWLEHIHTPVRMVGLQNNFEHFLLPTDAHNVKKRRVIKTF